MISRRPSLVYQTIHPSLPVPPFLLSSRQFYPFVVDKWKWDDDEKDMTCCFKETHLINISLLRYIHNSAEEN